MSFFFTLMPCDIFVPVTQKEVLKKKNVQTALFYSMKSNGDQRMSSSKTYNTVL